MVPRTKDRTRDAAGAVATSLSCPMNSGSYPRFILLSATTRASSVAPRVRACPRTAFDHRPFAGCKRGAQAACCRSPAGLRRAIPARSRRPRRPSDARPAARSRWACRTRSKARLSPSIARGLRGVLRRSNSEDCACLSPRLHLPADWCKQAAAASGTGKEQGEPMEGEKRGLLAVEMRKDAAFIARVLGNIISDMRVCLRVQFTRPGAAGPSTLSGYGRTARAPRAFEGSSCRPTSSPCQRSTTPTTGRTGSGA